MLISYNIPFQFGNFRMEWWYGCTYKLNEYAMRLCYMRDTILPILNDQLYSSLNIGLEIKSIHKLGIAMFMPDDFIGKIITMKCLNKGYSEPIEIKTRRDRVAEWNRLRNLKERKQHD